jgi:hypothetical protein
MIQREETDECISYRLDTRLHRTNGPALIGKGKEYGCITCWYLRGNEHRYYGPSSHLSYWVINGRVIKYESR